MRWFGHNFGKKNPVLSSLILSLLLVKQFWKRIFVQIMEGFDPDFQHSRVIFQCSCRWDEMNIVILEKVFGLCLILSLLLVKQFWKRIFVQIMEGFDAHFWQEKKCEGGFSDGFSRSFWDEKERHQRIPLLFWYKIDAEE